MGSKDQATMQATPLILTMVFLVPTITAYQDEYAAVRKFTPVRYRGLVFKARKIFQMCENRLSTLAYNNLCDTVWPFWNCNGKRYGHDKSVGAYIQDLAAKWETGLAKNWANDYMDARKPEVGPGGLDWPETMRDKLIYSLEADFNTTAGRLVSEAESVLRALSKKIKSSSFEKFEESLNEFTLSSNQIDAFFTTPDIRMLFDVEGFEDYNDSKLEALIEETKHFVFGALKDIIIDQILKIVEDVWNMNKPNPESVLNLYYDIDSEKNPDLEHLFLRILEEIRTERFLQRLDSAFKDACSARYYYTSTLLHNAVEGMNRATKFVTKFINAKKKLDLVGMITEFKTIFPKTLEESVGSISQRFGGFDQHMAAHASIRLVDLILQDCDDECQEIVWKNDVWAKYKILVYMSGIRNYFYYLQQQQQFVGQEHFFGILFNNGT